ncbi:MAG: hypothetical protein ACRELY_24595 [Polyangiaceae bacterium]
MKIVLTKAEALVLFEWLSEREDSQKESASDRVFWQILGQLEKVLAEPFAANYREQLEEARRLVMGS